MSILNITLGQLLKRFRKEPEHFYLAELSPWKGRRAIVYKILDDCLMTGITSYKDLKKEVKKRTGVSCSSALIAAWKGERMKDPNFLNEPNYPDDPPPPSPRTGKEKPKKPYKP